MKNRCILYVCDRWFTPLMVSLEGFLEHYGDVIDIYIVARSLNDLQREVLKNHYGASIIDVAPDNLAVKYQKFYFFELLKNYQKVLYMDCDTLAVGDVSGIFDCAGKGLTAHTEQPGLPISAAYTLKVLPAYDRVEQRYGEKYMFNTGVLMLDAGLPAKQLQQWAENFISVNHKLTHPFSRDQSMINIMRWAFELDFTELPHKYNVMTGKWTDDVRIVHYTFHDHKPWSLRYREWHKIRKRLKEQHACACNYPVFGHDEDLPQ